MVSITATSGMVSGASTITVDPGALAPVVFEAETQTEFVLVQNFFEESRQVVPEGGYRRAK